MDLERNNKYWWLRLGIWTEEVVCPNCGAVMTCTITNMNYSCAATCEKCLHHLKIIDREERCAECSNRVACLSSGGQILVAKIS